MHHKSNCKHETYYKAFEENIEKIFMTLGNVKNFVTQHQKYEPLKKERLVKQSSSKLKTFVWWKILLRK